MAEIFGRQTHPPWRRGATCSDESQPCSDNSQRMTSSSTHFVAHFVVYASSHALSDLRARRFEHGPACRSMKNPPENPEEPKMDPDSDSDGDSDPDSDSDSDLECSLPYSQTPLPTHSPTPTLPSNPVTLPPRQQRLPQPRGPQRGGHGPEERKGQLLVMHHAGPMSQIL